MADNINELLYNRILDITAVINFPLKLFAIYVVLRHTPPPLRHYSFFILNTMIWNFIGNVVFSFMHLVPLFPAHCFRVDGISRLFVDSELFGQIFYIIMFLLLTQCALALVFIFPHRYIVFAHPKLASRIRPAWVFGLCGGVHVSLVLFALIYYPTTNAWKFSYDDYPNKAELPDRPFVFCFDPNGAPNAIFDITYLTGTVIVIFIIVVFSILFLRKVKKLEKRITSDATLALQKKVFSSLLMLTAVAALFYCIPVVLLNCGTIFSHSSFSKETAMISIVLLFNHGVVSAIAYLLFFKAYRDAVRQIFSNLIATLIGRKNRVQSIVIKSSSLSSQTVCSSIHLNQFNTQNVQ